MHRMTQIFGLLGLIMLLGISFAGEPDEKNTVPEKKTVGQKAVAEAFAPVDGAVDGASFRKLIVNEPKTHKNLSVYLICAEDAFSTDDVVPLNEALGKKMIVIHETGDVNQLRAENVSDKTIFIHAGDIVRGGKQDRTLPNDILLRPKSGQVPLDSFCVEQGRWRERRGSSMRKFDSSVNNAYANKSKLAMRKTRSQRNVWSSVSRQQSSLSSSLGASVRSSQSESSLELTMDHEKVKEAVVGFEKTFKDLPATMKNSVGVAIVINGKIYSTDTYASHDLFMKIWPKILKGAAIEAISQPAVKRNDKGDKESKPTGKSESEIPRLPGVNDVRDFLTRVRIGKKTTRDIDKNTRLFIFEIQGETLFRTVDLPKKHSIHDSYVVEDENDPSDPNYEPDRSNDQIQLRTNRRRTSRSSSR